ncbi:unnamed protein product [Phytophthora lilii]|uniref:Unnamed protein product n=1 Tax=Phytophthora lilii TaxID=2077276 RepID=A0A9W6TEZ8_9STRA|nr:unnamed protein product [Phytophthora lilii]
MSSGQIKFPGVDESPTAAHSKLLPERLQTSNHLGYVEERQLPSSVPTESGEGTARIPRTNSGISRFNSFTSRSPSWRDETTPPVELPSVPTSSTLPEQAEENGKLFTQGRGEGETPAEISARLVRRSSLDKGSTGEVFRSSRVLPISSNGAVDSRRGSLELEDAAVSTCSTSERTSSHFDPAIIGKRLSMHRVRVTSRSNSVVAVPRVATQQPHDPSIHRMIYFRTKKELSELFALPPVSLWGRRFNRVVFVLILFGIADLAIETCDGPNMGSTDPGYPYLPSEEDHEIYDGLLAMFFTLEFVGRIIQTRSVRAVVRDPYMWLDLVGISPWYIMQIYEAMGFEHDVEHHVNQLRLLRTVRLALTLRHYEQTKIMYLAIKASLRPLGITLFFLFTLVMIVATAIFYAEPCYNVETCTFTDIFNSAYFVMVTVATVGYGQQVPSLKNPASLMLTMLAMILGQIYFSMPVAIIGNNFQLTYENFQLDKKKKARYLDTSLSPFDCQKLHSHAKRLCDIQYHLLNSWAVVHQHINGIARTNTRSSQSMTMDMLESEAERQTNVKEGINRLLEVHTEATMLLQVFIPHRRRSLQMTLDSHAHGVLSSMYAKAKKVMSKAKVKSGHSSGAVDPRTASQTLRGRLWLLLEVPDSSRLASIVNQAMVGFALVSVMLFFTESLQELAASGVETNGCRSVVKGYCRSKGFNELDPACFLRLQNNTNDFTRRLDFSCFRITESTTCYGNGLNFGSLNPSALACKDAFSTGGVDYVCYRQQCRASLNMLYDMGPYWIYFEWLFGIIFTLELGLRFYIFQERKQFWKDFYVFFDVVAIIPFFVGVVELSFAHVHPDYAIVATSPSFLSVIRYKTATKHPSARKPEPFTLSDEQLLVAHEFESMRRTILNLQRTLDAAITTSLETVQRRSFVGTKGSKGSTTSRCSITPGQRSAGSIDQSIEQKSFAIMVRRATNVDVFACNPSLTLLLSTQDTLLQFSQVVERLQEAPMDFEAFEGVEDDLHAAIYPNGYSPRPPSDRERDTLQEMEY